MKKTHSRIGLILSLAIHGILIGGGFAWLNDHKVEKTAEYDALSMELVAALLEHPQVAVASEPVTPERNETEEESPEPEVTPTPDPVAIQDPTLKPQEEKPKKHHHKRKERKEKPKERVKRQHDKPIRALERGIEAKKGIVAKAVPGATPSNRIVAGVVGGQKDGSQHSNSTTGSSANGGNADALSAYKVALQRALQRRANNSYPQREKMMRKTGTVTIKFNVLASGAISNVSVIKSSGNSNLDSAAVRSAEGLKMPPPPAGFPPSATVPVKFSIE